MQYHLEHQNGSQIITKSVGNISLLQFVKHATFAGIRDHFLSNSVFRFPSLFLQYAPSFMSGNSFRLPPGLVNDPNEKGVVSNMIGRAFADFFSKRIYGAKFTHCYESAMLLKGYPIKGRRPDYYCDTLSQNFAVEAKGYTAQSISNAQMGKHKHQSTMGRIAVNFSVASVAYDLYKQPKIKFYDPVADDVPYDQLLNTRLKHWYYEMVMRFVEEISISDTQSDVHPDYVAYNIQSRFRFVKQILVHKGISKFGTYDFAWLESVEERRVSTDEFYIDVDGIGLVGLS